MKGKFLSVLILINLLVGFTALSQDKKPDADKLISVDIHYPPEVRSGYLNTNIFTNFFAESIAGKIQVLWNNPPGLSNSTGTVFYSVDYPEHTFSRNWQYLPLIFRGPLFNASIPVDDVDVPIIYFITIVSEGKTNLSPMRICYPRAAGLEAPSRPFWHFLEGFEEISINWRILNTYTNIVPLHTNCAPKNGKVALCITLPEGRRSISVGTTRLRGWQIEHSNATGFSVWLKTNGEKGQVQFSLVSYFGTPKQVVSQHPQIIPISSDWKRVELNFNSFPKANLIGVDLLVFEFSGNDKAEFYIDDLSLSGKWMVEIE